MCGLYGAMSSTSLIKSELDNLNVLATLSTLRGVDSAGFFSVYRKKKNSGNHLVNVRKDIVSAVDHMNSWETQQHFFKTDPHTIAGHCRAATVGAVTEANAHPFSIGNLVGMHNGTVPEFAPKKGADLRVSSDSQELYKSIDSIGLQETLRKAKDGAWALVWLDYNTSTINFIRNSKRTLYYVKGNGVMYWASERSFLEFMIDRAISKVFGSIEPFKDQHLYTFPLASINGKEEFIPLLTSWASSSPAKAEPTTSVPQIVPHIKTPPKSIDGLLDSDLCYKGWMNTILSKRDAEAVLNNACIGCNVVQNLDDEVYFLNKKDYLCSECISDEFHKQYIEHAQVHKGTMIVTGEEDISNAH